MSQELNKLEFSILERLSVKYPFVRQHIPFLKVASRENTGAGMYVNFVYDNPHNRDLNTPVGTSAISADETIEVEGLKYGLGYEVDITDGKLKFIELFTYGEEWNGVVPDHFTFAKSTDNRP